jgi:hypothetical protein
VLALCVMLASGTAGPDSLPDCLAASAAIPDRGNRRRRCTGTSLGFDYIAGESTSLVKSCLAHLSVNFCYQ